MEQNKRVLLLYKDMIPSVRLCGHCQLEEAQRQGNIDYRHRPMMEVSSADLSWAQVVLMCRLDNSYELGLAQRLHNAGKYLIYVIDDDLLNVPPGLISSAYFAQKEKQRCIRALIALSDAVLSPSPVLLQKFVQDGRRGILLEEPAIDPVPYAPRDNTRPIRIGFAGSVDRTGDIEQILKETLRKISKRYGSRVEFAFFGAVPSFAEELHAKCIPYCDSYDQYRQTLNELQLDIGLAPMPDTPFHACKHYNKFIEYAAAGIVGVYSNVRPYDRLKTNFGWTLLCGNTADEWYHAVERLIEQPAELDRLKQQVIAMAHHEFSIPVIAKSLADEIAALPVKEKQQEVHVPLLGLKKIAAMIKRSWSALLRYGLKAPALFLKRIKVIK